MSVLLFLSMHAVWMTFPFVAVCALLIISLDRGRRQLSPCANRPLFTIIFGCIVICWSMRAHTCAPNLWYSSQESLVTVCSSIPTKRSSEKWHCNFSLRWGVVFINWFTLCVCYYWLASMFQFIQVTMSLWNARLLNVLLYTLWLQDCVVVLAGMR